MDATSKKIMDIRTRAGATNQVCPTCGRPPASPYRRFDDRGKVTEGCIDAIHEGQLVTPSESSRWHSRKEAKEIRRQELHALQGKGRKGR